MATPTIRALRTSLPELTKLTAIGPPMALEVFRGTDWFDHQIEYRKGKGFWNASKKTAVQAMRECRLDTIALLTNSFSSAWLARFSGARRRIGYARDGRSWLLTDRLPVPKNGRKYRPIPAIDYYLEIAKHLGCDVSDRRMSLVVSQEERNAAELLWQKFGWTSATKVVVINSTGTYGQSKLWPEEYVAELAKRLAGDSALRILLHCGPAERDATNRVAASCGNERVRSMGEALELPLGLSKAVMERAVVVVSTDSGPRHLAIALDRPVVSLHGSTGPAWTATYNRPETTFFSGLDCQPCYKRSCPLGHHQCMRGLTVDRVYRAVLQRIQECSQLDEASADRRVSDGRNAGTRLPEVA